MIYKALADGDLDLNHLLSHQKPHSSEPLALQAWCKPAERAHSSSELAQAEETPVHRQLSPVLLATAQAQNAKRVKVQDKPRKNPIQSWNSSCQRTASDAVFSEASDLQLGRRKLVAPGSASSGASGLHILQVQLLSSFQSQHCLDGTVWAGSVSPCWAGWWPGVRRQLFVPVQKQVTVVNHADSFRCKQLFLSLCVLICSVTSTGRYVGGEICWLQSFKLLTKSLIRKICGYWSEKLQQAGIDTWQ